MNVARHGLRSFSSASPLRRIRWWLGALLVSAVGAAQPVLGPVDADAPGIGSDDELVSDETGLYPDELEEFDLDVTALCEVALRGSLRRTTGGRYVVGATLKNVSGGVLPGPLLLIPATTGIEGLHAADVDGHLEADSGFFELLPETGELARGEATRVQQISFELSPPAKGDAVQLTADQLAAFSPTWQVRRDKPEPRSVRPTRVDYVARFAGKRYSFEEFRRAVEVQERWTPRLLAHPEVFGSAVGEDRDGRLIVQAFAPRLGVNQDLPATIEGVPLQVYVMGQIHARPVEARPARANRGGITFPAGLSPADLTTKPSFSGQTSPRDRVRPCGIGSSTSNIEDSCLSGTVGFVGRTAANAKFLVSNFHVWSDLAGPVGDGVLQPSRGDSSCATNAADVVGVVADFEPIQFDGSDNTIDASVATMGTVAGEDAVLPCTPLNGYGFPRTTTREALIGDRMMKYGRTSQFTSGRVFSVNATINVTYGAGRTARFIGQVGVRGEGTAFSAAGDSGSLIVDTDGHPVALLFASSGMNTFGNPIGPVLTRFGLSVVGDDEAETVQPPDPESASIGDRVWFDKNKNGRQDPTEKGVRKIAVRLFSAGDDAAIGGGDDTQLGSRLTDKAGRYEFSGLPAGTYFLEFTPRKKNGFGPRDTTGDENDNDVDPATRRTAAFFLDVGMADRSRDAGMVRLK